MKYFGILIFALMLPVGANATLVLTPGGEIASGPETSQALIDVAISGILGSAIELYKENVEDGFDTGPASAWYTTTFLNSPSDPEDANIIWGGGSFISDPNYLLVKDGSSDPAWYLFDISGWDGMMDIQLRDFWEGEGPLGSGAISHVTLYGGACCEREVPEPGPLGLLGLGMIAVYIARRRRRAI